MGGKTGSAQIFDFHARHYTHTYNGSFVGFAPLSNPAIVVVVTVNGTHLFGGTASAPPFKAIAEEDAAAKAAAAKEAAAKEPAVKEPAGKEAAEPESAEPEVAKPKKSTKKSSKKSSSAK